MRFAARALILVAALASPAFAQQDGWIENSLSYLDGLFGATVDVMSTVLFADFGTGVPFIVVVLVAGGVGRAAADTTVPATAAATAATVRRGACSRIAAWTAAATRAAPSAAL